MIDAKKIFLGFMTLKMIWDEPLNTNWQVNGIES